MKRSTSSFNELLPNWHTDHPSGNRGVWRIPLTLQNTSEDIVNIMITRRVIELATEGKRVCGVPKRLQDGITLDWIRDEDVRVENVDEILRKIGIKSDSEQTLHIQRATNNQHIVVDLSKEIDLTESQPDQAEVQRATSLPVRGGYIPISNLERARTADVVLNNIASFARPERRRMRSPGHSESHFRLLNLAAGIDSETLTRLMLAANIPSSAVLDIRLRDSPTGRFATITIAEGFKAENIRQTLLAAIFGDSRKTKLHHYPRTADHKTNIPPLSFHEPIDLTLDDAPADKLEDARMRTPATLREDGTIAQRAQCMTVEHGVAEQVSDVPDEYGPMKPMNIPLDPNPGEIQMLDDPYSPALSYLTLDDSEPRIEEPAASPRDRPETQSPQYHNGENVQHEVPPSADRYTVCGSGFKLTESDSDSDDDSSSDTGVPPFQSVRAVSVTGTESLATRVLHGIVTIEDATAAVSENQRCHLKRSFVQPIGSRVEDDEDEGVSSKDSSDDDDPGPPPSRRVEMLGSAQRRKGHCLNIAASEDRSTWGLQDEGYEVTLPKTLKAKGRRLLIPSNEALPIAAVYMHGDIQFIDQRNRNRISRFSLPCLENEKGKLARKVSDASLIDDNLAVIAYERGHGVQVSCFILDEHPAPRRVDLLHRGHTIVHEHRLGGPSSPNPGIFSLATMLNRPRQFLTGGGDGSIRLWTLREDGDEMNASSKSLFASYFQPVSCLAFSHHTARVIHANSKCIYFDSMESQKSEKSGLLSAEPQQIHIHPQAPSVVILEVDHLDRQIQIFDTRKGSFNAPPCMEFGHRDSSNSIPVRRSDYRYCKGSTHGAYFARGYYGDGTVSVWDYRNPVNIVKRFERRRKHAVTHTVLSGDEVIAYGGFHVTFWGMNMESS